jgi:hypothetical protein
MIPDRGAGVIPMIQRALIDLGFMTHCAEECFEHYGEKTMCAIRGFQAATGLRPSGELDEETLYALGSAHFRKTTSG